MLPSSEWESSISTSGPSLCTGAGQQHNHLYTLSFSQPAFFICVSYHVGDGTQTLILEAQCSPAPSFHMW